MLLVSRLCQDPLTELSTLDLGYRDGLAGKERSTRGAQGLSPPYFDFGPSSNVSLPCPNPFLIIINETIELSLHAEAICDFYNVPNSLTAETLLQPLLGELITLLQTP